MWWSALGIRASRLAVRSQRQLEYPRGRPPEDSLIPERHHTRQATVFKDKLAELELFCYCYTAKSSTRTCNGSRKISSKMRASHRKRVLTRKRQQIDSQVLPEDHNTSLLHSFTILRNCKHQTNTAQMMRTHGAASYLKLLLLRERWCRSATPRTADGTLVTRRNILEGARKARPTCRRSQRRRRLCEVSHTKRVRA